MDQDNNRTEEKRTEQNRTDQNRTDQDSTGEQADKTDETDYTIDTQADLLYPTPESKGSLSIPRGPASINACITGSHVLIHVIMHVIIRVPRYLRYLSMYNCICICTP